jgi:hypothetical protein
MKLVHALIAKSLAETLLVATLAVLFYVAAFPPALHGWGEALPHAISGWAVNQANQSERLEVQLFIDGKFVGDQIANQSRPDIVASGWARDEWHGYVFSPKVGPGMHVAHVYVLHLSAQGKRQTLQLAGDPIWFTVADDGVFSTVFFRR